MLAWLKKAVLPLAVLVAGAVILAVLNATKPEPEVSSEPPRPLRVYAHVAEMASAQLKVETHGEVRPRVRSEIVAEVGGRIVEVSPEFIEGGRVEPGEALAVIESTDYVSARNEAEARLASAQVDLEQALADADVARKQLAGQRNPSPLALKKPQVARARAALEAAEANLSLAQTNVDRTRITLPYSGRIASTGVDLGQFVARGQIVGQAFSVDKVEIRLPLTDQQLGALGVPIGYTAPEGKGLPVDLTAEVAGKRHSWTGRLARLDAAVDSTTRVVYATAEVTNPYDTGPDPDGMPLAVGLFVDAIVSGRIVDNAIQIPAAGLRAGNQVFVLSEKGRLDVREVDVIYRNSSQAVLESGIVSGELIVTSAIRNPIPGMALEAIDEEAVGAVSDTSLESTTESANDDVSAS